MRLHNVTCKAFVEWLSIVMTVLLLAKALLLEAFTNSEVEALRTLAVKMRDKDLPVMSKVCSAMWRMV